MTRAGRDLERLVATIEELLGSADVEIKSPDYVIGVNSGARREIDVSLRTRVGSVEILVILEVRDRKDIEDVTWIEQLATKRDDVRASKVVAISSAGFSKGARELAERLGVELRSVDSLTGESIANWFRRFNFEVTVRYGDLKFQVVPATDNERVLSLLESTFANVNAQTPIFIHTSTDNVFSTRDVLEEILAEDPQLFDDLQPNGETRQVAIRAQYPDPDSRYQILTEKGPIHVEIILLWGEIGIATAKIPISRVAQYAKTGGDPISQSACFSAKAGGVAIDLGFHKIEEKSRQFVKIDLVSMDEQDGWLNLYPFSISSRRSGPESPLTGSLLLEI